LGFADFADFYSVSSKLDTFTHSSEDESSNYFFIYFTSFYSSYEETWLSYETGSVTAEMFSAGFIN
jgi:hypothetical protein